VALGRAVLGTAVQVQKAKVGSLGLLACPPFHEASALTPIPDNAVRVHQKNRVITHIIGECRKQPMRPDPHEWLKISVLCLRSGGSGFGAGKRGFALLCLAPGRPGAISWNRARRTSGVGIGMFGHLRFVRGRHFSAGRSMWAIS
jgi:hypothetical protein